MTSNGFRMIFSCSVTRNLQIIGVHYIFIVKQMTHVIQNSFTLDKGQTVEQKPELPVISLPYSEPKKHYFFFQAYLYPNLDKIPLAMQSSKEHVYS